MSKMRGHDRINAVLPDELIFEIFARLDSKASLDAFSLVCKRWHRIDRLSRTTLRVGSSDSPELLLGELSRRFVSVKNIHVDELLSVALPVRIGRRQRRNRSPLLFVNFDKAYRRYISDIMESFCLTDAGLAAIGESFGQLEKLSLIWCSSISSNGLRSLAGNCASLKSLDLQGCYVGDEGLAAVGECCKHLEELNLRCCEGLSDVGLIQLATGCGRSLKSLGIAACPKITDVSLVTLGSQCASLEMFSMDSEVMHDEGLLAVVRGCHQLKTLKLQCTNITDEGLKAIGCCSSLELLALHNFQRITNLGLLAVDKGCKHLKSLSLSDCAHVTDKGLEAIATGCRDLMHLEINGCHSIGTLGLESVGRSCMNLTELALLYCQRIGNDALIEIGRGCRFLQALHLVDCPHLGDDAISSIARGCPNLTKLHVRRCYEIGNKAIMAVGEHCKNLTDLSLRLCDRVGDEALIAVGQGCPLRHLNVSGCREIGDAGIIAIARGCPQLTSLDVSVLQNIGDMALLELGEGCSSMKDIVISHCRQITDSGLFHLVKNCGMLESCHMVYCPANRCRLSCLVQVICTSGLSNLFGRGSKADDAGRAHGALTTILVFF
ncbi:hypothetical protein MLD38_016315 [Melastoma candidum]|uniref:Uncharacterized protein n=1 Tax=Melastoma candidum TaxID=119954 RepID=A0ACB9RKZ7_9MYRT|nr:hypothetical protein MLD38_016315 [Melastoma candidum]